MLTIREQLQSLENAIEKVKNSQEYKTGSHNNRYAQLKELEASRAELLSLVSCSEDYDLTLLELNIKRKSKGTRAYVSFQ